MRSAGVLLCALFICSLLALAACGKKGDPEAPQPDQFPHQYPAPEAIPETGKNVQPPAEPAPQQPPILSPLTPIYP